MNLGARRNYLDEFSVSTAVLKGTYKGSELNSCRGVDGRVLKWQTSMSKHFGRKQTGIRKLPEMHGIKAAVMKLLKLI